MTPRSAAYMPEVVPVAPIRELPERPAPQEEPPARRAECKPEKPPEPAFTDRVLSFLSPLFKRLLGREPEIEDLILAGVILLFLYDRMKSKKECDGDGKTHTGGRNEKKEGGLASLLAANFSDQDLLLLALFYIFL